MLICLLKVFQTQGQHGIGYQGINPEKNQKQPTDKTQTPATGKITAEDKAAKASKI